MAQDNFNRPDQNPLGSPWLPVSDNVGTVQLVSKEIRSVTDGDKFMYYPGAAITANQYSQDQQHYGGTDMGPAVRVSDPGGSPSRRGYCMNAGTPALIKFGAGGFSQLQAFSSGVWFPGNTARLEVRGNRLQGFINGVLVVEATDNELTSGQPGFFMFGAIDAVDTLYNWSGGDLLAAQVPMIHHPVFSGAVG